MSCAAGPDVNESGLVLALDIANGLKNATGNISTNLIQNGNFINGSGSPNEGDSNPTNTIVQLANPGNSNYVLRQNGNNTEYQLNVDSGMVANTTYVMSGWYAKSSDYDSSDTMFHARAFSSSGAHNATGTDTGTLIYSIIVGGLTWEYRYQTIATPSDFSGAFDWYVGYGANNTAGYRYYTNLKLEKGTYPSLYNLLGTGNNGECVNGLSYNSSNGGSIIFDGTNDYVAINQTLSTPFTITGFVKYTDQGKTYNTFINTSPHTVLGISLNRLGGGEIYVYIGDGSNWVAAPAIISSTNMVIDQWYHIAFTSTGSGSTLYLNGVNVGTSASSPSGWGSTYYLGTIIIASGEYLKGNIGSTQIYNRALTASEIQQNFNANRSRFGI